MKIPNNEQLLTDLINQTTEVIQVFSSVRNDSGLIVDFICIVNNKAAENIFGNLIGMSLHTLNPEIFGENSFERFLSVVKSGELNQSVRDHLYNAQYCLQQRFVKRDDSVAIISQDITKQIKDKEQIKANKESLQAILDGSLHFIQAFKAVRDETGKIIDFTWIFTNQIWIQHYGDVIGKSLLQQNPAVIEAGLFDQFVQVTESGIPIFQEKFYTHEQFNEQWFYQTLVKLGDGFIMNTEDITVRRQTDNEINRLKDIVLQLSEEKYQTIFNAIEDGLYVVEIVYDDFGKSTGIRWVETNPAFEKITGQQIVAGSLNSNPFFSEHHWLDTYDQILKTGKPIQIEHQDQSSKRWYQTNASRIGGFESRLIGNILEDITERKQQQQRQAYLLKLSDMLRSISDPVEIQNAVAAEALDFFQSDRCYYCNIEEGMAIIYQDAFRNDLRSLTGSYRLNEFDLYHIILERGLPFAVDNIYTSEFIDTGMVPLLVSVEINAFVNVPVVKAGKVVGIFSLAQTSPRKWSKAEIDLAAETAERTWSAIEQAKSERAIQKSEEQLRLFITASLNHAYRLSADWKHIYSLARKKALLNMDTSTDLWMDKYVPEDDRPLFWETIHQAIDRKATFELEHRILQADGKVSWVLSRALPVMDQNGNIQEWLGASIDITLRKTAEISLQLFNERLEIQVNERTIELQKSRDQLQSMLDTTLLQISVLEAVRSTEGDLVDFKIISVNKELERLTGRTDLVGKPYAAEFPGIKEVGIFDMIVKTIQTGLPQQMEYYYSYEGFKNWFSCMFVKLNDGVVSTNIDITARKQAEDDRLKNYMLLQQSEDVALMGSWDFDLLKKSFSWSDGMYRLFDLEKSVEIRPEIYLEYATDDGRAAAEKVVKHILSGDSEFEETIEISVSGKIKVLHIKAAVVYNSAGNAERVLGVDMDITAIYTAEEKIRKMEAQQQLEIFRVSLSTLEEERHRISESLHNGIGQILYAVKLNLNGLQQAIPIESFKQDKTYIGKLLIDAIRETRRISHELMPATLEQFGLESAIRDICSQLSDGTKFHCTISGQVSGMERYMELAIYRTTQELMTNVAKHAKASECEVNVDVGVKEIRIHVSDNGQGMDKSKTSNPGIGLASIRSKIKLLNGDLHIESEPGKGTIIKVIIPQVKITYN